MKYKYCKPIFLFLSVTLIVGTSSCRNNNKEALAPSILTCDTSKVTFATIQPILSNSCNMSGCHNVGSDNGEFTDETYFNGINSVWDKQTILDAINHRAGATQMPQGSAKLPQCDINKIEAYFNQSTQ